MIIMLSQSKSGLAIGIKAPIKTYRFSADQQLPVTRQLFVCLFVVHPLGPKNRFCLRDDGYPAGATESRHEF